MSKPPIHCEKCGATLPDNRTFTKVVSGDLTFFVTVDIQTPDPPYVLYRGWTACDKCIKAALREALRELETE